MRKLARIPWAAMMGLIMVTWIQGSRYLFDKTRKNEIPLDFLAEQMAKKPPQRRPRPPSSNVSPTSRRT